MLILKSITDNFLVPHRTKILPLQLDDLWAAFGQYFTRHYRQEFVCHCTELAGGKTLCGSCIHLLNYLFMHCGSQGWILSQGWWRAGMRMRMSWEWVAADRDLLVWSLSPRNNETHQSEAGDHVEEFSAEKDTISNRIFACFSPSPALLVRFQRFWSIFSWVMDW